MAAFSLLLAAVSEYSLVGRTSESLLDSIDENGISTLLEYDARDMISPYLDDEGWDAFCNYLFKRQGKAHYSLDTIRGLGHGQRSFSSMTEKEIAEVERLCRDEIEKAASILREMAPEKEAPSPQADRGTELRKKVGRVVEAVQDYCGASGTNISSVLASLLDQDDARLVENLLDEMSQR